MQIRFLVPTDTEQLLVAINAAFIDYIVPFQLNAEQLHRKIFVENVRLDYSIGVFEGERIVGFIMHAVRELDGELVIYNAGTGVLPDYRGKDLVGKMYDYSLHFFKEKEVEQLLLEVIEGNFSAIRAYEKKGFTIRRKLMCFGGIIKSNVVVTSPLATVTQISRIDWLIFQSFWDISPSWQSAVVSIDNIKPGIWAAIINERIVGYVLFSRMTKRIYHIAVHPKYRRKGIGSQLMAVVEKYSSGEKVVFNNVDESADHLKLFLEKHGLVHSINQFEMIKKL